MNTVNLFLITLALIHTSYTSVGFELVGPFGYSAFKCLQNSYPNAIPFAIVRVYQHSRANPGIDSNGLKTFKNCHEVGLKCSIYIESCPGLDPSSQIDLLKSEILNPIN
jgi:hypothetical protein